MFSNIGGKIKGLAKLACWLGIIASVIFGSDFMYRTEEYLMGFLYMIGGSILAWIGSFLLYGFGELIDTVMYISGTVDRKMDKLILNQKEHVISEGWKCAYCGKENSNISSQCKGCGKYRS